MYSLGDILLVNDDTGPTDLLGGLIQAGEKARYGKNAPADVVWWTHSALIVSQDGHLVEALANGVARSNILKYAHVQRKVISLDTLAGRPVTQQERELVVAGALEDVGLEYNRVDFAGLAIQLLFGVDWGVNDGRADICSELVSRFTEKVIPRFQFKPGDMMPLDIDVYAGAAHGGPLSLFERWWLLAGVLYRCLAPWDRSGRLR